MLIVLLVIFLLIIITAPFKFKTKIAGNIEENHHTINAKIRVIETKAFFGELLTWH